MKSRHGRPIEKGFCRPVILPANKFFQQGNASCKVFGRTGMLTARDADGAKPFLYKKLSLQNAADKNLSRHKTLSSQKSADAKLSRYKRFHYRTLPDHSPAPAFMRTFILPVN